MTYFIQTIKDKSELGSCKEFNVNCFNWGGDYRPKTTGRLGYVPDEGFWLHMEVLERNPVSIYGKDGDPVYKDSAVEAFINFYPHVPGAGYVNFEINSRGVMLAAYGAGRQGRRRIADMGIPLPLCKSRREEEFWYVELFIPLDSIYQIYAQQEFCPDSPIKCNFFKIKEGGEREHYASYAPIDIGEPDFHRPEFFAEGLIISDKN